MPCVTAQPFRAPFTLPLAFSLPLIEFDMPSITRRIRSNFTSDAFAARMRRVRIPSDAFDATKVALKAIQASTEACLPLKSGVSVALVLLEMSEKIKSNKSPSVLHKSCRISGGRQRISMSNSQQRWREALLRSRRYSEKSKTSSMGLRKIRFGNDSLVRTATRAKSRSMHDYWTRQYRCSVSTSNSACIGYMSSTLGPTRRGTTLC
ncbi:hypothetical protein C8R45DRAFT_1039205 [Mycena sanguinolenta]|nr:hypothetical protein C8R45DRAFT_1039205 [Mycena sanguinolenta]